VGGDQRPAARLGAGQGAQPLVDRASSASRWSIWPSATPSSCRLAAGSGTCSSQARVALTAAPGWGGGARGGTRRRGCAAARRCAGRPGSCAAARWCAGPRSSWAGSRSWAAGPAPAAPAAAARQPGRSWPAAWDRIYSRYVPGWLLARGELTIHADRGSSMASKPVAFLLADLGVTKSHSRPHCSNDNPYSEARFKTLKYRPEFPERFGCHEDALAFCRRFFGWYNAEHRHSGIGFHTPPMSTTGGPNRSGPSGPGCWTPPTPPIPSGSSPSRQYHPSCPPWRGSTNPRRGRSTQRIPDQSASQEVDSFRSPGHQLSSHSPGAS
jgi:transposase InsO family protein